MARSGGRRRAATALLLLFAAVQVVLGDGTRVKSNNQTPQVTLMEVQRASDAVHGVHKRSVSILARNGDLPYYRKEWNKKLHPGYRGMNVDDKEEESVASKRYVGALARGGGYPVLASGAQGKRAGEWRGALWEGVAEAEPLGADVPEDSRAEDEAGHGERKRGGIGSLARAGVGPSRGLEASGKRSVAALARSGELLSIGRGSNQEKEVSGGSASKRGLGSILRNGGISTLGKIPVYSVSGKRGIESLARNYALPSMLNQEYESKVDLPEEELDLSALGPMTEALYDEASPVDERDESREVNTAELTAKRHLGSFVRTFGFKPGMKRYIGSILKNGGGLSYNIKRSEEVYPYEVDAVSNDKRHISSLLKNDETYTPYKRDTEEDEESSGVDKRHLASILHDRNAFVSGKRNLGSVARQGLLGTRHEKREDSEWVEERLAPSVGKRSIASGNSGLSKGEASFESSMQDSSRAANGTTADELKIAAGPAVSRGGLQKWSTGQDQGDNTEVKGDSLKRRHRRSLMVPYSSSDEYPMPVFQNTDFYDLGKPEEEELAVSPGKRFMGRIPHMGRSRPRTGTQTQNPSRRRPRWQ